jgi:hypothetical protein
MTRALLALLTILGCALPLTAGQGPANGEWQMSFVSPNGPQELTVYLSQEGPRLTGHISSEYGEYPVRGSVDGQNVTLSWTIVEQGKELAITANGKLDGDSMTGTIRLGNVGTARFSATRTDSA